MGKSHCVERTSDNGEATQEEVREAIEEVEKEEETSDEIIVASQGLDAVTRCITDRQYRRELKRKFISLR